MKKKAILTIGRIFYGLGIAALGIHQLIIRNFRPDILPPFKWAEQNVVFALLTGIVLVLVGYLITMQYSQTRSLCFWLGFFYVVSIVIFHLPYILIFSPDNALRLDVWFGAGEALAYAGGAFVVAGTFSDNETGGFLAWQRGLVSAGRIFYAILILLFATSHFVFTQFVSTMVPTWIGSPFFWTYFVGVALTAAGIAIIFKIWIRLASTLLAVMLFLFFLLFHIPDAIVNPEVGGGNEIVRAFVALLFCGVATLIAATSNSEKLIN